MSEKSLMETQTYGYWIKAMIASLVPQKSDFDGVGSAIFSVSRMAALLFLRIVMLATSPVSVPLLALLCMNLEKKDIANRQKAREEVINSLRGDRRNV